MLSFVRIVILFSVSYITVSSKNDGDQQKRILLSDPVLIQNRFLEMESKIQNLTSRLTAAEIKIQTVESAAEIKIRTLETEKTSQERAIQSLSNQITQYSKTVGGAIFVRWGRNDCPDNETDLVYSGYVGGSLYTEEGSAVEYMCLPPDPLWGSHYDDTVNNRGGHMYGTEYQDNYFGKSYKTYYDDVPCAVCRSPSRSTYMMIPGRNLCYAGWTQEYSGNLASGYYGHKAATQFVCVDENPEAVPHGGDSFDGKLMYAVEGICGSLACPPYVNGRELTCVVCTK